jgi:hypothetical protein
VSTNAIDQLLDGLDAPQRENVLKALAEANVSEHDPFLAVMLAVSYKIQRQSVFLQSPARQGGGWWKGILTAIVAGAAASFVCSVVCFHVVKSQTDMEIARMATQIRENGQLVADLQHTSGELRYYTAANTNGQLVRIFTLNGGQVKPTEAFINASGAATVVLPAIAKP